MLEGILATGNKKEETSGGQTPKRATGGKAYITLPYPSLPVSGAESASLKQRRAGPEVCLEGHKNSDPEPAARLMSASYLTPS